MSKFLDGTLKVEVFGESHAPAIGAVVEGVPAGLHIDRERISAEMAERRPRRAVYSTARSETDEPEFLCGVRDGVTTGAAIALVIRNSDAHSADYECAARIARPSHADYPAFVRYGGKEDFRGGGAFSGRLTAPVVAVGAILRQWLETKEVRVSARIEEIAGMPVGEIGNGELPEEIVRRLQEIAADKNSCGGIVSGRISGLPVGLGGLMADSVESRIASMLYAVPAVKAVGFGLGYGFAAATGKSCNDEYRIRDGRVVLASNHNGGVLGGLTDGADVEFSAVFKPVPSIAARQRTVNLDTMEETELEIKGRHDVCIVPRAVPVVRAVAAIAAADLLLEAGR